MWLFSFIAVLGVIPLTTPPLVSGADDCPSACTCYYGYQATCSKAGLTEPPNDGIWPHISYLNLKYNNITSIADGMFSSFPSMNHLDVSYNQIESVSVGAFRNTNIGLLVIEDNKITTLRYLDVPSSLYYLIVGRNPLSFSDGSPLPLLANALKGLEMHDVGLEKLDLQILSGLPLVEYFAALHNKIKSIDLGNFFGMRYLETLDLGANDIETIIAPPDGVELQIQTLSFAYNRLTYIDPDLFKSLPKLLVLSIGGNPIIVPDNRRFVSHPSLLALDISDIYAKNVSSLTLDLPNLQMFVAPRSGLYSIQGAFVDKPFVKWVDVSENSLTEINAGTFAGTENLEELVLHGNPLVKIDIAELEAAMSGGFFSVVDIDDTPLACSCAHEELIEWADMNGVDIYDWCSIGEACPFMRFSHNNPRTKTFRRAAIDFLRNITNISTPSQFIHPVQIEERKSFSLRSFRRSLKESWKFGKF